VELPSLEISAARRYFFLTEENRANGKENLLMISSGTCGRLNLKDLQAIQTISMWD
jgi:hypothetical protein